MPEPRQGFVLSRHWRDTPKGTEIELWLATDQGPQRISLPAQESVAFIPQIQRAEAEKLLAGLTGYSLRDLPLQDFHSRPVMGLYCNQHRQLIRLEKTLKEGGITVYEADIRPRLCAESGAFWDVNSGYARDCAGYRLLFTA